MIDRDQSSFPALSGARDPANPPKGASILYGIMGPHWRPPEMRDPGLDSQIPADIARAADVLLTLSGRAFVRAASAHTGRAEADLWVKLLNYPVADLGKLLTASGWAQLAAEFHLNDDAPFVVALN